MDRVIKTSESFRTLKPIRHSSAADLPSKCEEVQLPAVDPLDEQAQRSAFYLRLNQL